MTDGTPAHGERHEPGVGDDGDGASHKRSFADDALLSLLTLDVFAWIVPRADAILPHFLGITEVFESLGVDVFTAIAVAAGLVDTAVVWGLGWLIIFLVSFVYVPELIRPDDTDWPGAIALRLAFVVPVLWAGLLAEALFRRALETVGTPIAAPFMLPFAPRTVGGVLLVTVGLFGGVWFLSDRERPPRTEHGLAGYLLRGVALVAVLGAFFAEFSLLSPYSEFFAIVAFYVSSDAVAGDPVERFLQSSASVWEQVALTVATLYLAGVLATVGLVLLAVRTSVAGRALAGRPVAVVVLLLVATALGLYTYTYCERTLRQFRRNFSLDVEPTTRIGGLLVPSVLLAALLLDGYVFGVPPYGPGPIGTVVGIVVALAALSMVQLETGEEIRTTEQRKLEPRATVSFRSDLAGWVRSSASRFGRSDRIRVKRELDWSNMTREPREIRLARRVARRSTAGRYSRLPPDRFVGAVRRRDIRRTVRWHVGFFGWYAKRKLLAGLGRDIESATAADRLPDWFDVDRLGSADRERYVKWEIDRYVGWYLRQLADWHLKRPFDVYVRRPLAARLGYPPIGYAANLLGRAVAFPLRWYAVRHRNPFANRDLAVERIEIEERLPGWLDPGQIAFADDGRPGSVTADERDDGTWLVHEWRSTPKSSTRVAYSVPASEETSLREFDEWRVSVECGREAYRVRPTDVSEYENSVRSSHSIRTLECEADVRTVETDERGERTAVTASVERLRHRDEITAIRLSIPHPDGVGVERMSVDTDGVDRVSVDERDGGAWVNVTWTGDIDRRPEISYDIPAVDADEVEDLCRMELAVERDDGLQRIRATSEECDQAVSFESEDRYDFPDYHAIPVHAGLFFASVIAIAPIGVDAALTAGLPAALAAGARFVSVLVGVALVYVPFGLWTHAEMGTELRSGVEIRAALDDDLTTTTVRHVALSCALVLFALAVAWIGLPIYGWLMAVPLVAACLIGAWIALRRSVGGIDAARWAVRILRSVAYYAVRDLVAAPRDATRMALDRLRSVGRAD